MPAGFLPRAILVRIFQTGLQHLGLMPGDACVTLSAQPNHDALMSHLSLAGERMAGGM
jgi:hypothetical protein